MKFVGGRLVPLLSACAFWSAPGLASSEFIKLRTQVFQEREVVAADGLRRVQRVPAENMSSGSEVIYEVGYSNTGPRPAQVVITNPLPAELVYQSYTARAVGAQLEVSVDRGVSFGVLGKLQVAGEDGRPRAAQATDITHVRWKTARPVKPGEAGYVSLRAILR